MENGLSQESIGKRIGLTQKGYSNIEIGITIPKIDILFELATILGVSPESLIIDIPDLSASDQLKLEEYKTLLLKSKKEK